MLFFSVALFVSVAFVSAWLLFTGLKGLFRLIVRQIVKRLELQGARMKILNEIAGSPPSPSFSYTIEQRAARQLLRRAERGLRRRVGPRRRAVS